MLLLFQRLATLYLFQKPQTVSCRRRAVFRLPLLKKTFRATFLYCGMLLASSLRHANLSKALDARHHVAGLSRHRYISQPFGAREAVTVLVVTVCFIALIFVLA